MFMAFLDFFRKKKVEEDEIGPEKIGFDEVGGWLDGKVEEVSEKEKRVFDLISEKIELFIREIEDKVKVLEGIDVESKKAHGRAKLIVRQGLDKYLGFVDIFIKELTEVEKQNLGQFVEDVNKVFADFDKHSYLFYERATFLIGDEMAVVKQEINNLSKYFTKLFSENQKIVDSSNVVSSTKLKLKKLDEVAITLDKISLETKELDKKIVEGKEKEKKVLGEIEEVKVSRDYVENLKKREEIELVEKQLEGDILKLKSLVDFKALSSAFHSDEKKMKIVKSYKENFQETFAKDGGESILNLVSEAKLGSKVFADKIEEIDKRQKNLGEIRVLIKKDVVGGMMEEVQKIKSEIENLSIEKVKQVKRSEGIEASKEGIREVVGVGVGELGGVVF